MKQKVVGHYSLGHEDVEVVLREGTGGEFWCVPEDGHIARIKIGADYTDWSSIISVLLHEAFELVYERLQCRFDPTDDMGSDHSSYLFVASHTKFLDACSKVAMLLSECLPDLSEAWRVWNKSRKGK
jgi:hypothetical protein